MKKLFITILAFAVFKAHAQDPVYPPAPAASLTIVKAEYFLDADPGFGLGIDIPLTAANDIAALAASVNTSSLTAGVHRLYIRTLNAEGRWSLTSVRQFVVDFDPAYPATASAPLNVVKMEYFIDADPGFGNGTNIPVTASLDISALAAGINTAALTAGTHRLYVRSLNTEGSWSVTAVRQFTVDFDPAYPNAATAPLNVVKMEYFIDADPGFGNGTEIALTASTDISSLTAGINTASLNAGSHRLYVRSLNAEGKWSITTIKQFAVDFDPVYPSASAAPLHVVKAEYFIDTDPGFGNGTNIPITAAADIPALVATINTNTLPAGAHRLYTRTLNAEGEWSITSFNSFIVNDDPAYPTAPAAPGNITFAEYFFDTDPGFGNGTAVTLTPGTDISNLSITVNTGTLSAGLHRFYIRSFDDWGFTNVQELSVNTTLPVTFKSFTAKVNNRDVVLNWQTLTEQNSRHFEVERSADGISFKTIAQVTAAGNSVTAINYQFADNGLTEAVYYYRLRQVDLDGKSMYSAVLRVAVQSKPEILLMPNPVAGSMYLKGVPVNTAFTITDINGRIIMTSFWNGQAIELSKLPAGYYTMQLFTSTQKISKSFIKQ